MTKQKPKKNTRSKTKQKQKRPLSKIFIFFLISLALTPLTIGLYLYNTHQLQFNLNKDTNKTKVQSVKKEVIEDKDLIQKMTNVLTKKKNELNQQKIAPIHKEKNSTQKELNQTIKKETIQKQKSTKKTEKPMFPTISDALSHQKPTEAEDYLHSIKQTPHKKEEKVQKRDFKGLPKLAIIIDDVSFQAQVDKIKKIPYKVTASFLPPTKKHPFTPKLAKTFPFYMVHLPLEAYHHKYPEARTLKKGESYKSIHRWIKQIKRDFPQAKYYNNHTGSKFTSDISSMDRLYRVFKKEGLIFVDSRTTAQTKAPMMAKKYKMPLLARDVFLDNSYKPQDIKKQLLEAVKVAKLQGFSIAICHPHSTTLKVLRNAKPLLKGVKLVYLNEL